LYYLLAKAERMAGNHTNPVWRAQVGRPESPSQALPMVIKYLDGGQIPLCIELSCGLAAQALQLPIPAPALVLAERDDLKGLPASAGGQRFLLIGSQYKKPDALYAQIATNHPAAEEFVWSRLCASETGAKGAAWDELVANPDRHSENLLFDGQKWWLFDHDLALPTTADYLRADANTMTRQQAISFQARFNQLASQMLERRPADHTLDSQAKYLGKHKTALTALAAYARGWQSDDATITGIYQITAILIDKIALRLPALAQHLHARMSRPDASSLWTSHSQT